MIDLNAYEMLLIWGVYGMSILLSVFLGYYVGILSKRREQNGT